MLYSYSESWWALIKLFLTIAILVVRVLVILPESLIGFFIKRGSQYELILESLCSSRGEREEVGQCLNGDKTVMKI